jgi:hypothetical protein
MMDYGGAYSLDDEHLVAWFEQIFKERRIDLVIETGTNAGRSTEKFCGMVDHVISIDVDPDCTRHALGVLTDARRDNYSLVTDDSAHALTELVSSGIVTPRTFLFIDAHMHPESYWPLPDEIRALPKETGILAFHDIKVPDRDFLYSRFMHDGQVIDFDYAAMKPYLDEWSPTHRVEYNREASGSRVGVAVVYPR